jgi:hypothetical protein
MHAQPESMAAGHISVVMWPVAAPLPKPDFFETLRQTRKTREAQGKLKG